mmetsp:Transcript_18272/g.47119  ORF Transcript_18272/g.47119 Transcript_18272/m.47119 type:complete len:207 (-) Transcript_18272:230-850(-)
MAPNCCTPGSFTTRQSAFAPSGAVVSSRVYAGSMSLAMDGAVSPALRALGARHAASASPALSALPCRKPFFAKLTPGASVGGAVPAPACFPRSSMSMVCDTWRSSAKNSSGSVLAAMFSSSSLEGSASLTASHALRSSSALARAAARSCASASSSMPACLRISRICSSSLMVLVSTVLTRERSFSGIQPSGSPAPGAGVPSVEPLG